MKLMINWSKQLRCAKVIFNYQNIIQQKIMWGTLTFSLFIFSGEKIHERIFIKNDTKSKYVQVSILTSTALELF